MAQREQPLLGAHGGAVPARAADGAEQDGVGALAGLTRGVGERLAGRVDRGAAEWALVDLGVEAEARRSGLEHEQRRRRDLGTDAVTREDADPHARASAVVWLARHARDPTAAGKTLAAEHPSGRGKRMHGRSIPARSGLRCGSRARSL